MPIILLNHFHMCLSFLLPFFFMNYSYMYVMCSDHIHLANLSHISPTPTDPFLFANPSPFLLSWFLDFFFDDPMNFIEVVYRNIGEGLLTIRHFTCDYTAKANISPSLITDYV